MWGRGGWGWAISKAQLPEKVDDSNPKDDIDVSLLQDAKAQPASLAQQPQASQVIAIFQRMFKFEEIVQTVTIKFYRNLAFQTGAKSCATPVVWLPVATWLLHSCGRIDSIAVSTSEDLCTVHLE